MAHILRDFLINRLTGLTDYYILSDEYYFTYYNYILQCFLTDKCLFFQILIISLPYFIHVFMQFGGRVDRLLIFHPQASGFIIWSKFRSKPIDLITNDVY